MYSIFTGVRFRFYFPHGKTSNQAEKHLVQEAIRAVFQSLPNQQATIEKFGLVTKVSNNILAEFIWHDIYY